MIDITAFTAVSGCVLAYWMTSAMRNVFHEGVSLQQIAEPKQGLATADNNRFLRLWSEISLSKAYFNATDFIQAMYTGKKWFPYNKGGEFRRWYGNNDYLINYESNGKELQEFEKSVVRNPNYYFKEAVTWSKISSGKIAFRYKPCGHIFDVAGTSVFCDDDTNFKYLLGLLNSKVIQNILEATSPTLNYEVGQIANLPIIINKAKQQNAIDISNDNIEISKQDWDSFETSWDFKKHPLI